MDLQRKSVTRLRFVLPCFVYLCSCPSVRTFESLWAEALRLGLSHTIKDSFRRERKCTPCTGTLSYINSHDSPQTTVSLHKLFRLILPNPRKSASRQSPIAPILSFSCFRGINGSSVNYNPRQLRVRVDIEPRRRRRAVEWTPTSRGTFKPLAITFAKAF